MIRRRPFRLNDNGQGTDPEAPRPAILDASDDHSSRDHDTGSRKARQSRLFVWKVLAAVAVIGVALLLFTSVESKDLDMYSKGDERSNTKNVRVGAASGGSSSDVCSWYLAPSSIPGAGGLGIFTTKRVAKGSRLFENTDGPTLVIQDAELHNGRAPEWVDDVFMWKIRHHLYKECDFGRETSPNLGVMINHHDVLQNTRCDRVDEEYDDSILNRFTDPGAGAISYHTGRYFTATRDIAPGEEMFNFDGESYIRHQIRRAGGDISSIPYIEDYNAAGKALNSLVKKAKNDGNKVDDAALSELHEEIASRSSRAASLLPRTARDLSNILKIRSAQPYLDDGQVVARHNLIDRSLEWIKEKGRCLDNVVPGRSKIPQAGQGAFATRFLAKGSVVVPVPLLVQVTDRKTLDMYKLEVDSASGKKTAVGDPIGHQLLMNYCYGHERSSLLLCAGSNANLINHCSGRMEGPCGKSGANAKLRWATDFDPSTSQWLGKSLDQIRELVSKGLRGLTLEVVATRDIQPGEEVFLDYGVAWEAAWASHLERWKSPAEGSGFDSFAAVSEMNRKNAPVRTEDELRTKPYPANIMTLCKHSNHEYYPCIVLERNDPNSEGGPESTYTAQITHVNKQGNEEKRSDTKNNLRRSDIMFSMKKYSSDEHLPGAFRHYIGVPDDLWPKQWKDLGS